MKSCWLNKQNNQNLIVFFAGWSFDANPFKFLDCGDSDVLFVYDYNKISKLDEFECFNNYRTKTLVSWSMGVFSAYLLRDVFRDFDLKTAINGTVFPVDNSCGIPVRSFELTLKHAAVGLEGSSIKIFFLPPMSLQNTRKLRFCEQFKTECPSLKICTIRLKTPALITKSFTIKP